MSDTDNLSLLQAAIPGGYSIILADPPWRYADRGCNGAAEKHYSTMSPEQVAQLPVAALAAPDCVLFMWGTYPQLPTVLATIEAWGFQYKTIAFQWIKTRGSHADGSGKEFLGLGQWTRGNSEPCFLAVRGKPKRVDKGVGQLIWTAKEDDELVIAPVGRHSAKPKEVRERIVKLLGDLPRIELFAREVAPGWHAWGDEIGGAARRAVQDTQAEASKNGVAQLTDAEIDAEIKQARADMGKIIDVQDGETEEAAKARHAAEEQAAQATQVPALELDKFYALADGRLARFVGTSKHFSFFVVKLAGVEQKLRLETKDVQAWPADPLSVAGDAGPVECPDCHWLIAAEAAENAESCPFCGQQ